MSELLRAVLDQQCVDNRTAVYTIFLKTLGVGTGAINFVQQTGAIQLKTDTYFLAMTYARFAVQSFDVGSAPVVDPFQNAPVQLIDAASNKNYSNGLLTPTILNYNLNQSQALSEYILFEPRKLITASIGVQTTDLGIGANHRTFLVFAGIEYQMPGGV